MILASERMHRFVCGLALSAFALILAASVTAFGEDVDPTFNAVPSSPLTSTSSLSQIVQPDGKVILYGPKLVVDATAKGDIVRLNVDGTLDTVVLVLRVWPQLYSQPAASTRRKDHRRRWQC
jgi:hypothetical protein